MSIISTAISLPLKVTFKVLKGTAHLGKSGFKLGKSAYKAFDPNTKENRAKNNEKLSKLILELKSMEKDNFEHPRKFQKKLENAKELYNKLSKYNYAEACKYDKIIDNLNSKWEIYLERCEEEKNFDESLSKEDTSKESVVSKENFITNEKVTEQNFLSKEEFELKLAQYETERQKADLKWEEFKEKYKNSFNDDKSKDVKSKDEFSKNNIISFEERQKEDEERTL